MYKKIRISSTKTRDEHRLIMEQHIGRSLEKNEVVHHVDGDKSNNHISNLRLMTDKEHRSIHCKELWQNPSYRLKRIEHVKQWHAKQDKSYKCRTLKATLVELAKQAWPCHSGSLRSFSRHYSIHHKTMGKILGFY